MLARIPPVVLLIASAASLFCCAVIINFVIRVVHESHSNDVALCRGLNHTTAQSNRANGSLASVLNQSLANIQARANTKKELPSDKASAKVFIQLIANLRTSPPMDCSKLK